MHLAFACNYFNSGFCRANRNRVKDYLAVFEHCFEYGLYSKARVSQTNSVLSRNPNLKYKPNTKVENLGAIFPENSLSKFGRKKIRVIAHLTELTGESCKVLKYGHGQEARRVENHPQSTCEDFKRGTILLLSAEINQGWITSFCCF